MQFAENEFYLCELQPDGASRRDIYKIVEQQLGRKPDDYLELPCPPELLYLWNVFIKLSGSRQRDGMGGMSSISYLEMLAYDQLMQFGLTPQDVDMIKLLDDTYLVSARKPVRAI
ncbi:phage tail assembly chaperone [Solimicrobium silvestre]|uniref:phage tail assembly chaperone n=1 Tax=Solimicrobium silvestre TaxID=2099400 RepID=UPI0013FD6964|nr:hypothetical protein [Solimicrobium silvestre]